MFRFCSCGRFLGVKEPVSDKSVTTGVCRECLDHFKKEVANFWHAIEGAEGKDREVGCLMEMKEKTETLGIVNTGIRPA